jgi:MFS family permease
MLFLRFVQGAATIMAWSLIMTTALDMTSKDHLGASMAIVGTGLVLGLSMGAPVGGALGNMDALYPLYGASALFLAATLVAFFVLKDVPITHKPDSILSGLRILVRDRRVVAPFLISFAERFSAGFLVLLFPLYMADKFGSDPMERGLFLAAFLLPFALLQYPFGRFSDRFGRRWLIIVGGITYGILFSLIGSLDVSPVAVVLILCGVFAAVLLPVSLALIGDISPKGERATFMGGFNSMGSLGFAVGPLLSAAFSEAFGYELAFAAGGAIVIVAMLVSAPFIGGDRMAQAPRKQL